MRRFLFLLVLLFAGSGCAALIYEVVWFQLLQLVIGSSAVSLGVLLGTYMGGMCLGSLLLPRVVSPRAHPLRVYAWIELGIGALRLAGALRRSPPERYLSGDRQCDRSFRIRGNSPAAAIAGAMPDPSHAADGRIASGHVALDGGESRGRRVARISSTAATSRAPCWEPCVAGFYLLRLVRYGDRHLCRRGDQRRCRFRRSGPREVRGESGRGTRKRRSHGRAEHRHPGISEAR